VEIWHEGVGEQFVARSRFSTQQDAPVWRYSGKSLTCTPLTVSKPWGRGITELHLDCNYHNYMGKLSGTLIKPD